MTIKGIQPWRRVTALLEATVIIGLPFLRINYESALRFDIPTLRLHIFGMSLWMEEFYIILIAVIFISLLFILITIILGRIWCGWACPQTVLSDLTSFIEKSRNPFSYLLLLLFSILVSANLIWYFVSPYDFFPLLFQGELGRVTWTFWIVLTVTIFLNLLILRYRFCATVCPYARLQGTLFDDRTLIIAFDESRKEECMDCIACVKACPVDIDIRKGLTIECTACARCIDRCAEMVSHRDRPSLINYSFGIPGEGKGIMRQNVILIGLVTMIFLVYLLYLLISRPLIDMEILPNQSFQSGRPPEGRMLSSYVLSIKNRGREGAELIVKAKGLNGKIVMRPEGLIKVDSNEIKRLPVYIRVFETSDDSVDVKIMVESRGHPRIRLERRIRVTVR